MVGIAAPLLIAGGNALRFGVPKLAQRYAPGIMNYGRGLLNTTTKAPTAPVAPPPTMIVNRAGQAYTPIPSSNALVPYKSFPRLRNAFLTPEGKIRKGRALATGLGGYIGGNIALDTIGNQFGGDAASPVGSAEASTTDNISEESLSDDLLSLMGDAAETPEKKATVLDGISNLLSDPTRLEKIITGISLLEGTPVEEAVKLGSAVSAIGGSGGKVDTEVYDTQTGQIVFRGSSDSSQLRQFVSDPDRYEILDRGTIFDRRQEQIQAADEARLKASQKQYDEFAEIVAQSGNNSQMIDRVLGLLESGELETGAIEGRIGAKLKKLAGGEKARNIELLESLQTQLAVLQRLPGSGQTSDLEFQAYRDAVVGLDKSEDYNKETLRRVQVAQRLLESRLSYLDQKVFEEGKSYAQANAEFTKILNDEDSVEAGKWLNVDAVIFNDDDYQLLEEGGKYLFLNPSDPTTYNTIR